jgi:hypothetical protein
MSRGILYLIWRGECDPTNVLERSLASVRHWHPELPVHVEQMPDGSNLLCKSKMFERSLFDETLFLDADTTVMGRLDYGFAKAEQHGIACCVNANPWQRRYYKIEQHPDAVEYSSGVVFFDKSWHRCVGASTADVFRTWDGMDGLDTTCSYFHAADGVKRQPYNDQALFSHAMHQQWFNPFVLPLNWNLYPRWQKHWWGEIKVLHGYDDIPASVMRWNAEQSRPDAVIRCAQWPDQPAGGGQ